MEFPGPAPGCRKGVLSIMKRGGAFRLVGMILGIVGTVVSVTALAFSIVGMVLARRPIKPNIR